MAPLQGWAQNLKDGLELALEFAAKWIGKESGGSIVMSLDFLRGAASVQELQVLLQARLAGEISRETFLSRLQIYGLLDDDFDAAADAELLEDDAGGLSLDDTERVE
jgi:hypothetical protein